MMELKFQRGEVYKKKVSNMARVLANIGTETVKNAPAVIGLSEVENRTVIEDLANDPLLVDKNYGIIHFDSPDERGIDVALIFNNDVFKVLHSETFSIYLEKEDGTQDFTRDILLVTGKLANEEIHVIVNHWSSRREG